MFFFFFPRVLVFFFDVVSIYLGSLLILLARKLNSNQQGTCFKIACKKRYQFHQEVH